jgi:Protein of unknown function (DUF3274)
VYSYFTPRDATVGLMNVQGIGWQGVPEEVSSSTEGGGSGSYGAFPNLGANFRQRIFTSKKVDGKPFQVGLPPQDHTMRGYFSVFGGDVFSPRKSLKLGASVRINGEELHPPITPFFESGEEEGHAGKLAVGPVDAANTVAAAGLNESWIEVADTRAIKSPVVNLSANEMKKLDDGLPGQTKASHPDDRLHITKITPSHERGSLFVRYTSETANNMRKRLRQTEFMDNSYHSAIPAHADHAEGVTAYDLSIGMPLLPDVPGKTSYWAFIRAVANWRTDWALISRNVGRDQTAKDLREYLMKDAEVMDFILDVHMYYKTGVIPKGIGVASKGEDSYSTMPMPKLVENITVKSTKRRLF